MRDLDPKKDSDPLKSGRNFDEDLQFRYLSPGAFTVLPPDEMPPPDPPQAPIPYRLTPTTRRNRNQAFSIIAEPTSRDASRSPSPTGRISPFRGRGFNPSGSRHTSPAPSPPPGLAGGTKPPRTPTKKSKIPQMNRRNSSGLFGEKVTHAEQSSDSSSSKSGLNSKLSKSMTNINPNVLSNKPPPSPQKGSAKNPAFRQLSPIIGSSPEPSQSQSSPSRIPTRSRSQPQSRVPSPSRPPVKTKPKLPTRTTRSTSRVQSRNPSREPSPSGKSSVPSKLTAKYQNVQSKVNSFSKPKVPPKPPLTSDSELSDIPANKTPKYRKPNNNRVTPTVKQYEHNSAVKSKFINTSSNRDTPSNNKNSSKRNITNIVNEETILSNTETIMKNVEK
ncbi:hypothetical protein WA026_012962 [Henosepilachna vigintioctopunctata]|uniref:Uncharacterized protein n=1 Tax=Henosepilachna vigintioctopunctata TaxID=420089 RepID=A0AAW1TTW1_9CUCU